jgi:hypothetical protein
MVTPKIKELRSKIKTLQEEALDLIKGAPTIEEIGKLPEEEKIKVREDLQKKLTDNRVVRSGLEQELKEARMNKNDSAFFSWSPSGRNRQQRRAAIRSRVKQIRRGG